MTEPVDVAVLVVSYNSAADIEGLLESIHHDDSAVSRRIVVADNASTDATAELLRERTDITFVQTGANLGYAAGVNAAAAAAGDAKALLILNPDATIEAGSLQVMYDALMSSASVGAVVPRIIDGVGETTRSMRHEPSILRALGDTVLGPRWSGRPGALTELVRDRRHYERAREVAWATGAAIMIRADVARSVGNWDESFFLFSEETDYCRRIRDAGWSIRFLPEAIVQHQQGGSGVSDRLVALTLINKVRYYRKVHGRTASALFRFTLVLGEELRRGDASHRLARRALRDRRLWPLLDPRLPSGVP